MLSPDSTMEDVAVKTEPSEPSDSTELGGSLGHANYSWGSMCGDVGARCTPLISSKSLPSRSTAKRKFHDCSGNCTICIGLPRQVDPIIPQYEAGRYDSSDVTLNVKPDPNEIPADYGPSGLNTTDPIRSVTPSDYDEKKEGPHDGPCVVSMDTNLSCDTEYDNVAKDPTKTLAGVKTLPNEPNISGIVGAKTYSQMIGKSLPSTSGPRRKSSDPLPPISEASAQMKKVPGEKPYACNECNYRTADRSNLRKHKRTHTGEKPYACDKWWCGYRTAQASALKSHMATHTGDKPYTCGLCNYRAAQASNLKSHMLTHADEKQYACVVCDYKATQAAHLKRHMTTHTGEKPYACDVCDYRAAQAISLKSHMTTHTGEKHYACDVCGYRTAQASNLKCHMATHTGDKPYACDLCDYRAAQASNLKCHMATHTGEKQYACAMCDYRAVQASHLKRHMATHTGEKPYVCHVCDYRALQAVSLQAHMATHTGIKPYACDVCNYRTTRACYLKRHMLTHRGKEALDGGYCVPECSNTGMTSLVTESTSQADQPLSGPSHHVDPYFSLTDPLKHDLNDPSADYGPVP